MRNTHEIIYRINHNKYVPEGQKFLKQKFQEDMLKLSGAKDHPWGDMLFIISWNLTLKLLDPKSVTKEFLISVVTTFSFLLDELTYSVKTWAEDLIRNNFCVS